MRKEIGKIRGVKFGYGGYQDAQLGISFMLGSEKECWGVRDFKGTWSHWTEHCKWTKEDQVRILGETVLWIKTLLGDAQVTDINDLIGVPIEVTFDGNILKEWRILTEVI